MSVLAHTMELYTTPGDDLTSLITLCSSLTLLERKALISLARSNLSSWRYRRYVDLDDVKSAGFYGRSREWVNDGLANTRSSLSPEPEVELDY